MNNYTQCVTQFGVTLDGVTDDTAAWANVKTYLDAEIAAGRKLPKLIIPHGVSVVSNFPNLAYENLHIECQGHSTIRYTGTGNAITFDGSGIAGGATSMKVTGPLYVEAPKTAFHGVVIKHVHHSTFELNVRGAGATGAGLVVEFAVCNLFPKYVCSENEMGGWYNDGSGPAKPQFGVILTRTGAGADTASYNTFINPIIEHVYTGIYFKESLGNTFFGGTAEGCANLGALFESSSMNNTLMCMDLEENSNADILDFGIRNRIIDCDTGYGAGATVCYGASAVGGYIRGGDHTNISVAAGAYGIRIGPLGYNRFNNGGAILDYGTGTIFQSGNVNLGNGKVHAAPPARSYISVGASPFSFTNTTKNMVLVEVAGGSVSQIAIVHNGVADGFGSTGALKGQFMLFPGDGLIVSYSSPPYMVLSKG